MIKEILIFVGGAGVGAGVAYYVTKNRFKKEVEKQVNDVKESFEAYKKVLETQSAQKQAAKETKKNKESKSLGIDAPLDSAIEKPIPTKPTKSEKEDFFRPDSSNVSKSDPVIVHSNPINYDNYNPDPSDDTREPFPIKEEDFGDQDDTCDWIVFSDGVVCADDSLREIINEDKVSDILGKDWMRFFGWDGTDKYVNQVYIRNNLEKIDVSICKDLRTYKEWLTEAYPRRALEEFPDD